MGLNYARVPIVRQAAMPMQIRFNCSAMSSLGQRIKQRRKELGISQESLGKMAGLDQTVISKLERGDVHKTSNIAELSSALQVSALWLSQGKGKKDGIDYSARQTASEYGNIGEKIPLRGRVPLISYVAAGNWSEAVDNFAPGNADVWVNTTVSVKQHTYALRVQGDSMEPRFPDGATIIVEPDEEAKNGSFVIVRQNGIEATFKQLIYDGATAYLKPINPRYPIMPMAPDAVICGVVKQMVMDI